MHLRLLLLAVALRLLAGCATMTGAALGHVLCAPSDAACRSAFVDQGLAMDTGTITVGGERYASTMVYDCETGDGRRSVVYAEPGGDASIACAMDLHADVCSCVHFRD